ncbi:MAG: DUF2142 domain-containing protein [bacterium]|nr:DUF2142 domain-containing protein [bacterium]
MRFLFFIFIAVGLIFTFLVPPFQKPDEETHFIRSLMISRGVIICPKNNPSTLRVQKDIPQMINDIKSLKLPQNRFNKFDVKLFEKPFFINNQYVDMPVPSVLCGFPTIPYIPQSIGLYISNLLHINTYVSFYIGRLSMLIFAIIIFVFTFKRIEKSISNIFIAVLSLPVTIHQLTSYNYDAMLILFSICIFALIFTKKLSIILLFIFYLILILCKGGGYELFLLTYFLIPYTKIDKDLNKYLKKTILFFVLLFIVLFFIKYIEFSALQKANIYNSIINPFDQIQFIFTHFGSFVITLFSTTIHRSIFYLQSLIGIFGWLEYGIPHHVYIVYLLLFLLFIIHSTKNFIPLTKIQRIILYTFIIGSYLFISTILYLVYTPIGSSQILGIQGRYFLPFVPFILILVLEVHSIKRLQPFMEQMKKITLFLQEDIYVKLISIYIASQIISSIIQRYY